MVLQHIWTISQGSLELIGAPMTTEYTEPDVDDVASTSRVNILHHAGDQGQTNPMAADLGRGSQPRASAQSDSTASAEGNSATQSAAGAASAASTSAAAAAADGTAIEDLDSGSQALFQNAAAEGGQLPDAAVGARLLRQVLDEAQHHSTYRTLSIADELLAGRLLANGEQTDQVVAVLVSLQSEHDALEFTRALNDAEALASEELSSCDERARCSLLRAAHCSGVKKLQWTRARLSGVAVAG